MSIEIHSLPTLLDLKSKLGAILKGAVSHDVEERPMTVWDKGVFLNELHKQGITLSTNKDGVVDGSLDANKGLRTGTYGGTRLALTEMYSILEEALASHFDSQGFDPIIPTKRDLPQKQQIYAWSDPADGYPPHLKVIPDDQQTGTSSITQILNPGELNFVTAIAKAFSFIVPDDIAHDGTPYMGPTIADCEKYNRANPSPNTDIMNGTNLGDKVDWYSDARFAQQHLTGVNPTTIRTAPQAKLQDYATEAGNQGHGDMKKLLLEGKDLFIQDYSWFRAATGVDNVTPFSSIIAELKDVGGTLKPTGLITQRYSCASVIIFQLNPDGRLHPLAITLDYRGSLDKSITIFNTRLTPDARGPKDEKDDWPWRYAKTCAQTADWAGHQVAVHLVETHLIEEAIIVATNRMIPEDHIIYELLSPHWFRTLALNSAARSVLVPGVIARLAGFGPSMDGATSRALGLIKHAYKTFNFQEKYVPNDLKNRGFDIGNVVKEKYRNYPYAYEVNALWQVIHQFVEKVLQATYTSDEAVQKDTYITNWYTEIQSKGQIPTFPSISTVAQLVDAVTMCIHTASPQHTAVNYLQNYYYSFVPGKPPALCTPLPKDINDLKGYTEAHLTAALPIGSEDGKWKDWLLAAQLPELLSYRVDQKYSLMNYATSLYHVNKYRSDSEKRTTNSLVVKGAAARFYSQLKELEGVFELLSLYQTKGTVEYKVLQPELTAVSILI
ncbi:lipoxygenase [Xylaria palmicola]|nr:lipoxygenase [Xylaria palmicola]